MIAETQKMIAETFSDDVRNEMERNEMGRNEMKICSLRNENL